MVVINFILNETVKQLKWVPITNALIVLYAILGANLLFDQNIVTQNNTSQQGVPQSYQNISSSNIHTLGKSVYSQVHFISNASKMFLYWLSNQQIFRSFSIRLQGTAHNDAKSDLLESFQSRSTVHHGDHYTQHGIYCHMKCFLTIRKHLNVANLLNLTITHHF